MCIGGLYGNTSPGGKIKTNKDFYNRLDNVMDGETITFSCEEADVLKDIVMDNILTILTNLER
jgi:hypothetical protein